ncbi:hypothetical protein [Streptomyces virginiae]|uniref:hypothetical protein n=1 Tax=Streptomyces virginiae TaxID=1961 RepID=UPI00224ED006|nr:hypothetical protein [Streptomyces virginiae]MCX4960718.1 hypothetical protein [Streptomyces virginiae]
MTPTGCPASWSRACDRSDHAGADRHRAGDTLVLVDTGVTTPFRTARREAADPDAPWSRPPLRTPTAQAPERRHDTT